MKKKTNKTTLKMQIMEDKIGNGPEWISVVYRSAYSRLVCFILTVIPFCFPEKENEKRRRKMRKKYKNLISGKASHKATWEQKFDCWQF